AAARSWASSRALASRPSAWTTAARRATSACRPSGLSCRRISVSRSVSRVRLPSVDSSLRSAFSLRLRCLRTPAASSMNPRRSSGVAASTASSCPCPTMTCISRPIPESDSSSWTSSSRQLWPLMAYSDPPLRNMVREMVTSAYSMGSAPSVLSMVSTTSARPNAGLPAVPAKMTSSILPPRRLLAPCSPMTQANASTTLDLPDPLGPTTQVIPGSRRRVVDDAKDLNPRNVKLLRCTDPTLQRHDHAPGHFRPGGRAEPSGERGLGDRRRVVEYQAAVIDRGFGEMVVLRLQTQYLRLQVGHTPAESLHLGSKPRVSTSDVSQLRLRHCWSPPHRPWNRLSIGDRRGGPVQNRRTGRSNTSSIPP